MTGSELTERIDDHCPSTDAAILLADQLGWHLDEISTHVVRTGGNRRYLVAMLSDKIELLKESWSRPCVVLDRAWIFARHDDLRIATILCLAHGLHFAASAKADVEAYRELFERRAA